MKTKYLYRVMLCSPEGIVIDEKMSDSLTGYLHFVEQIRANRAKYQNCFIKYERTNDEAV